MDEIFHSLEGRAESFHGLEGRATFAETFHGLEGRATAQKKATAVTLSHD
jgi:hypothetical protein